MVEQPLFCRVAPAPKHPRLSLFQISLNFKCLRLYLRLVMEEAGIMKEGLAGDEGTDALSRCKAVLNQ